MVYPVSEKKLRELESKIQELGLKESDFKESFIRSGGAGGQNVNKVATCVLLRHLPTGLEVRCQRERSQALNRYLAKRLLVEKIESLVRGKISERQKEIEKTRRQKRKRSRRAKEKMLQNKRQRSEKKFLRAKINYESP
jgi:protein subunit release factor B